MLLLAVFSLKVSTLKKILGLGGGFIDGSALSPKERKSRGFTLVELLVVIAIIAVLATLLLLQLGVARAKARDAKRIADVNQTRSALELSFDDNGTYPQTTVMTSLKTDGYLVNIPSDPLATGCAVETYSGLAGGAAFCYGYSWNGPAKFQVWADLEQKNVNAFRSDTDINSTTGGWGGATANGTTETCASPTAVDCVFDLGQP
ncbi:MAG: type II secretion system protein [Candidatus Paceibacterota bacterium]